MSWDGWLNEIVWQWKEGNPLMQLDFTAENKIYNNNILFIKCTDNYVFGTRWNKCMFDTEEGNYSLNS